MANHNKLYDGKVLFETWCSMGAAASGPRLIEFARKTYGRASQMGPTYSMWTWAFRHPEEAYPMWKEYYFQCHPENPPITFEEFILVVRHHANNKNVAGSMRNVERFCAKYGIDMDFRIAPDDVIQVTHRDHPLFQVMAIVDNVNSDKIYAHYYIPDNVYPEKNGKESVSCVLSIREIGVVGKAIV